jgi:glycosyltransferase involved in cell wall biosynthesis
MPKKVSIIIPTYNGEKYIKETIDSCLNQTYGNIEILVIDDCSTDSSVNIINSYCDMIHLIQNKENHGLSKSINQAAKSSQGDYLLFLGHDDMLRPNHIEVMLHEFDKNTAFVHCNADLIDGNGVIFGVGRDDVSQMKMNDEINFSLAKDNFIHSTGAVIQKEYFVNVNGWSEQYKNYGEWLLWLKLANIGKVKYTSKVRALYRRHNTNMTNSFHSRNVRTGLIKYKKFCQDYGRQLNKSFYRRVYLFLYSNVTIFRMKLSCLF